jgi:hypothetical protein
MSLTKNSLIELCENAVVSSHLWKNSESYAAQVNIADAWLLLHLDCVFSQMISPDDLIIWLNFKIDADVRERYQDFSDRLSIDSRDTYFNLFEKSMDEATPLDISLSTASVFIPTQWCLNEANGSDWSSNDE